jgi:hypothetical protein
VGNQQQVGRAEQSGECTSEARCDCLGCTSWLTHLCLHARRATRNASTRHGNAPHNTQHHTTHHITNVVGSAGSPTLRHAQGSPPPRLRAYSVCDQVQTRPRPASMSDPPDVHRQGCCHVPHVSTLERHLQAQHPLILVQRQHNLVLVNTAGVCCGVVGPACAAQHSTT